MKRPIEADQKGLLYRKPKSHHWRDSAIINYVSFIIPVNQLATPTSDPPIATEH